MGGRPGALPGSRAKPPGPAGARREVPLGHDRRPARSHRQPPPARPARPRWRGQDGLRHRDGLQPGDGAGARPAVPRPQRHGPDLRARLRARAEHAPAPRDLGRGGPALRAAGVPRSAKRRVAARAPGAPGPHHARTVGALAARHLRRPPHPPRPGGHGGRPGAGAPGPAGPGVLATEGSAGRRGDPERASHELPRRGPRRADRAARRRSLAGVEAPSGWGVPPPARPDARGGATAPLGGGAGHRQR